MTFDDLQFAPHFADRLGVRAIHMFPNGQGVSVVRFCGSYGHEDGLYEVAITKRSCESYQLDYSTPLTDDVIGYLTPDDVTALLAQVEALPAIQEAA